MAETKLSKTFDQNRVYAAVQVGVSPVVALELGYLNSFQERASGVDYFNRDIMGSASFIR
jgi:hypothetical protein